MSYTEYQKAQKLGEKNYKQRVSDGSYPYLPVLDEILSHVKIESQLPLGLVEIPTELIVGTYTSGRTTAFSADFMPLLDPDTEFGAKWSQLYDSLYEEGQREPVIAYEYLNRFYIMEGNKRVSVQKYMGAVAIEGKVTRVVPVPDDSMESRIYQEFLDFYALTKINYILMSREGNYDKLLRLISNGSKEPLSDEERLDFRFLHSLFKKEYLDSVGQRLSATVGDALLAYIEIFGYSEACHKGSVEIKKDIPKLRSEFIMLSEDKPFSLIAQPTEESQRTALIKQLISVGAQVLKIAFVYDRDPSVSGWSYSHDIGREHLLNVFGDRIETAAFVSADADNDELMEEIVGLGYKLIFTTTPVLHGMALKCSVLHPEVIVLNCSLNTAFRHVRSYYLRIYEAKFIIGAIAGSLTEENRIGYIADYPICGMPASLNAFALGVKLVNPRAQVYLDWSSIKDHDPYERFERHRVDLISNRDISAPIHASREFGLYGLCGETRFNIAMPVWDWGRMYEELVGSVLKGAWKNDETANGAHALNYYWGMSSGAIDVICSERLPEGTKQLVSVLKQALASGGFNPFTGKLYTNTGVSKGNGVLSLEEIINIDWFVDNIVGRIPDISELIDDCHELVSQQGLSLS